VPYLLVVSCIWAFSFGLTKGKLAGLDSAFISAARLSLALLVFLPFLRVRALSRKTALHLIAIGAVQFGVMYLALNESYRHLAAHEIVLFTLTTPVFVTLLADAFERTFHGRSLFAALLAMTGAAFIALKSNLPQGALLGLGLVQVSNLSFALGQVLYRRVRNADTTTRDRDIFALLYLGAVLLTLPVSLARNGLTLPPLSDTQLWTLLYLGVLASGVCFFWWNLGATRVNAGTLAVFNNVKVPLGVACSLVFFGERADVTRLLLGGAVMAIAVAIAESKPRHAQRASDA
jgi:drug/metabolite transporter (DMT)-like permease